MSGAKTENDPSFLFARERRIFYRVGCTGQNQGTFRHRKDGENSMRATVITDNIENGELPGEWGLCIMIEYGGKKILLDTGASGLFADNASRLDIPLEEIDFAVLSHAHYDHANGMQRFFEVNQTAKFYLQESCGENCYHKKGLLHRYIGMPRGVMEAYRDRIVYVSGNYSVSDGVSLIGHATPGLEAIGRREEMFLRKNGRWYPDDFSHEQSLVFETPEGLVIFNSCSHGGAGNIVREVSAACPGRKVSAFIGGLHSFNKSEEEVRQMAAAIRDTGIAHIYTGHCTGKDACGILKEELGEVVQEFYTGFVMEF